MTAERDIVIRPILKHEVNAAHKLELSCYTPEAAATLEAFTFRQRHFPRYFLSAWCGDELAGLACGVRTAASDCGEDSVKSAHSAQESGRHLCVLSVAVSHGRRRIGIGSALMEALLKQAEADRLETVVLMCEARLIAFYERLGFAYLGLSASSHGEIEWHEMTYGVKPQVVRETK